MTKPSKKNPLVLVAALAAGAVAVYLLAAPKRSDAPSESALEPAAALILPGRDGKTVDLAAYRGKVVLVDFWATWCDPCREEIPGLVALYDRLKGKDFVLLGVSMDEEGAKAVDKFTKKQPISYPLALNGGERAPKGWLVPGLPTAYLIGRDGSVVKRWFGEKDLAEVEAVVASALARK